MTNAMKALKDFEGNLVVTKAMIFQKKLETGSTFYVPVLCCVPEEDYHETCYGKIYDDARGTFIRFNGGCYNGGLLSTVSPMSLTNYERYLEQEGWSFFTTVPVAKGKKKFEALEICRDVIRIVVRILR